MALVYLVNKPHVLGRIIRWLLLFLEYDFTIVYKPGRTHVVVDALSRLSNITEPIASHVGLNHRCKYVLHKTYMAK
jgi:hypothetical protein